MLDRPGISAVDGDDSASLHNADYDFDDEAVPVEATLPLGA